MRRRIASARSTPLSITIHSNSASKSLSASRERTIEGRAIQANGPSKTAVALTPIRDDVVDGAGRQKAAGDFFAGDTDGRVECVPIARNDRVDIRLMTLVRADV